MISSHPQDEGMLSDRNEQDLFQSEQNSDENYSQNQSISEGDFVDDQEEDTFNYGEQNLLKQTDEQSASEKQSRKQVKETCCEKVKGYFGFGTLLSSQQIGYVFFIPISSKWTFKFQVIMMQILMGFFAYGLLFTFKYATMDLSKNQMVEYSVQNFNENFENYFEQFLEIQHKLILDIIEQNGNTMKIANDIVQQPNLISQDRISLDFQGNLEGSQQNDLPHYISQYTYNQVTYYKLDQNRPLEMDKIEKYFQLNFFLPFEYERQNQIANMNRLIFPEDNLAIIYPGITIKENQISFYQEYISEFDQQIQQVLLDKDSAMIPFQFDKFNGEYLAHYVSKLDDKNIVTMCIPLRNIESLFQWLTDKIQFQTFFYDNNQSILYGQHKGQKLTDIFEFQELDQEMFLNFTNSNDKKLRTKKSKHLFHKFQDKDLGLWILLSFNNSYVEDRLKEQIKFFDKMYNNNIIFSIMIILPLFFMFISFCLLYKWIKPMEQITQVAYLSLKKNKRLNQEELEKIKGDGLINQLTSLFKSLISQLSGMKQGNKAKLSQHYQQQTYPKNSKAKDLSQITSYFEVLQEKTTDAILSDNNDKIQNLKLIPSFDE